MPLTSNTSSRLGIFTMRNPSGVAIYSVGYTSYEKIFNVTPNPCVNPGDRKRPNAYSFTISEENSPQGWSREWYQSLDANGERTTKFCSGNGVQHRGQHWYRYSLSVPAEDSYNRCLAKLYDAVKQSELNLSTTIGEGRETLHMLYAIAKSATGVLRDLRKADRALKQALRDNPLHVLGGTWLGWSVGWKPLLSDLENMYLHVKSAKAEEILYSVKARASAGGSLAIDNGISDYYQGGDRGKYETLVWSKRHEMGLTFRIKDLNQYEQWRAGLTVRPTLAWELTRLSFVVDYFYNFGQLLELFEAACFNNGTEFVGGYHTSSTLEQRTFALHWATDRAVDPYGDITAHSCGYTANKLNKTKSRTLLTAFPQPSLPILKIPSASTPLLNIAALLTNLISRK